MRRVDVYSNDHSVFSALNGNNGEATNSDDRKTKGGAKKPTQKRKQQTPQLSRRNETSLMPRLARTSSQYSARDLHPSGNLKLSKCALKLAVACAEPFHPAARGVCGVIGSNGGSTIKNSNVTKFTVNAGTAGDGYVLIAPCLANDGCVAFYTTSTYANSNSIQVTSAVNTLTSGVAYASPSAAPFSQAQLYTSVDTAAAVGRILSVGVRISYTGKTVDCSGNLTLYSPSRHTNVTLVPGSQSSLMGFYPIQSNNEAVIKPPTRNWESMVITPTTNDEMSFNFNPGGVSDAVYPFISTTDIGGYNYAVNGVNVGNPVACILIDGATPGVSFQVEIIQHVEYLATNAGQGYATPAESDEQGGALVLRAAQSMAMYYNTSTKSGWPLFYDVLSDIAKHVAPMVVPRAISAVAALV